MYEPEISHSKKGTWKGQVGMKKSYYLLILPVPRMVLLHRVYLERPMKVGGALRQVYVTETASSLA